MSQLVPVGAGKRVIIPDGKSLTPEELDAVLFEPGDLARLSMVSLSPADVKERLEVDPLALSLTVLSSEDLKKLLERVAASLRASTMTPPRITSFNS